MRELMGTSRAFLLIRDDGNKIVGRGEFTQTSRANHVLSTLSLHFKDGSIDEETAQFTQGKTLRLVKDHHVQKGPRFPKSLDMTIDANGNISESSVDDDKTKSDAKQEKLPPDVTNGMIGAALLNLAPHFTERKFSFVAPNTKGRIIQLKVTPERSDSFAIAETRVKADVYRIHYELGGVTGVIALLVGKQPPDAFVWVTSGVPSLVREQAALYNGGPTYSLELAGATFAFPVAEAK